MATETIKEFLVALGFKSDEAALKKFTAGVEQATKVVFGLAAAVEGAAVTVAIGVSRFASTLETLYFATLKTGASATNLRAFDRAAQDFGVSAGEAQHSVEGLAQFLRLNPGGEGVLASWFGVKVTDEHGNKRDMVDVLLDIGNAMKAMPQWQAQMFGKDVGLSVDTIRALQNGEFAKNYRSILEELKKAGFGKAAEDAHKFMVDLRKLGDQLTIFGTQVYEALQNRFKVSLESVTQYLQAHGPEIAQTVVDVLNKIIDMAEKLKPVIIWVYDFFKKLDDATDGWSTKLLALGLALKFLGAGEIVGGVLSLAGAFVKLGAGLATVGTAGASTGVARLLGLLGRGGLVVGAGVGLGYLIDKLAPNGPLAKLGDAIGSKIYDAAHPRELATQALTNMGWKREQAEGIVNSLNAESALNPHAEGDGGHAYGIAQWHEDRQAQFAKMFGHTMRGGTGDTQQDLQEQLRFLNSADNGTERGAINLARAAASEADTREVMVRQYLRPADPDAEIERAAPNISQKTDIHVNGSGIDAAAVARAISAEQARVNAQMIRELSVGVQ